MRSTNARPSVVQSWWKETIMANRNSSMPCDGCEFLQNARRDWSEVIKNCLRSVLCIGCECLRIGYIRQVWKVLTNTIIAAIVSQFPTVAWSHAWRHFTMPIKAIVYLNWIQLPSWKGLWWIWYFLHCMLFILCKFSIYLTTRVLPLLFSLHGFWRLENNSRYYRQPMIDF